VGEGAQAKERDLESSCSQIGGRRDSAGRDLSTTQLNLGEGELFQGLPGDSARDSGSERGPSLVGLIPMTQVHWHGAWGEVALAEV